MVLKISALQQSALVAPMRTPGRKIHKNHVKYVFISTERQKFNGDDGFCVTRSGRSQNEVKGQKKVKFQVLYISIGLDE